MVDIVCQVVALLIVYMLIIRLFRIFIKEGAIKYIKDDWLCRLPDRVHYNRYRGLNRMCYCILSVIYYIIKDFFLLYFAIAFYFYKFFLWDIWNFIFKIDQREWFNKLRTRGDSQSQEDVQEDEYTNDKGPEYDNIEELPFCQLFNLSKDTCLMIDHVEMCPDETAFIRVVDEEGYTPLYKRKVKRNRVGDRLIQFNGKDYFLDDKRTQPVIPKQ